LRRGESAALIASRSPTSDDGVRRFAALGHDALADIQAGRLIIGEFAGAALHRYTGLGKLTTTMREFESLIKGLKPGLVVFDEVQALLATGHDYSEVLRFYNWATSFGATTLLIAAGDGGQDLIQNLKRIVRKSFRLDMTESKITQTPVPAAPAPPRPIPPPDLLEEDDIFRNLFGDLLGDAADWLDVGEDPPRVVPAPGDTTPRTAGSPTVEDLLRPTVKAATPARAAAVARLAPVANLKKFKVLVLGSDTLITETIARALRDYTCQTIGDEASAVAAMTSFKPDLLVLDIDLPIKDGFRLLQRIRQRSGTPVIVVSGMYVRTGDRLRSLELGADYYLTKPFSLKELRQKSRLLIARHRGLTDWIVSAAAPADPLVPYSDFVARVEENIRHSDQSGLPFSVVGCAVPGHAEARETTEGLFQVVRSLVRSCDLISRNDQRDLVVLLAEADAAGARAFTGRLQGRASRELKHPPVVWVRSYPVSDDAKETGTKGDVMASGRPPIASRGSAGVDR
jgi:CheY-like chemotaxis protein